ncbi:proline-rich transmembrane protein 1-like [Gouania willdenowi]|uniref:proline-rich transmembrane protein 1-like n=1 Tax=Gouania willdenowi TaxID=441366 RepID=UPI001054ACD0|nr:proline-rich transmembrane protein 1-like [Gouania willdenowi]
MDPTKSVATAPPGPETWSNEKNPGGQSAPPPYQDNPYPGQPQPGPGYPPQGYGYPQQYGAGAYLQQPHPGGVQPYPGGPQPYGAAVTVQPTVYVTQGPLANPVNDYLGYSIFTMLCCCLPLGIAALVYSISAREANNMGNQAAAERSSRTARTLNHVALGIGIGFIILWIVYTAVAVSFAS